MEGAEKTVIDAHDWKRVPVRVAIVEMRPADEENLGNAKAREAIHGKGMCRYAADMGHCNEVRPAGRLQVLWHAGDIGRCGSIQSGPTSDGSNGCIEAQARSGGATAQNTRVGRCDCPGYCCR